MAKAKAKTKGIEGSDQNALPTEAPRKPKVAAKAVPPKQASLAECNAMQNKANAAQKAAAKRLEGVAAEAVAKEQAKMDKE